MSEHDYIIRPWAEADRPQLRALWKTAFADDDAFIDGFFEKFLRPGGCVVAQLGGRVVSAMYVLFGQTLYPHRRDVVTAGYTYALATLPECRGRGIGTAVYRAAVETALRSADAACVLPAERGLYPFYEKASGAAPVSFSRLARFTAEELKAHTRCQAARVSVTEYAGLRESFLSGWPHAALPWETFELMEESGCDLFVLENGLAAAETDGGVCRVRELLDPDTDGMASLAALAAWCPAREYIVRSPVFFDGPGQAEPFMLAVLREKPAHPIPDDLWWGPGLE